MKKILGILVLILALGMVGCSSGGGDSDAVSKASAVQVKLSLAGEPDNLLQKSVKVNLDADSLSYWVQATPLWTGTDIQNAKATLTEITYEDGVSLGYFTPGAWTFYVAVKNGENIIYDGTLTPVYISTSSKDITIPLTLYTGQGTGSVTLKIAVPRASASAPVVTVEFGDITEEAISNPTAGTTVSTAGVTSASNNWYYFEKTYTEIDPGNYNFVLSYYDEEEGNKIGGAAVSVTVRNGDEYLIAGTIENGLYQIANLTLTVPGIKITNIVSSAASIAYADDFTVTITATINATEVPVVNWFVNGADANPANNAVGNVETVTEGSVYSATYTLKGINGYSRGLYDITCIASDQNTTTSAQIAIRVTP